MGSAQNKAVPRFQKKLREYVKSSGRQFGFSLQISTQTHGVYLSRTLLV